MEEDALDPGNWPEGFAVRKYIEQQPGDQRTKRPTDLSKKM
jgi:hypothetical protein